MANKTSTYEIKGSFKGANVIIGEFKRIQQEARKTATAEVRAKSDALKKEREKQRAERESARVSQQFMRDRERMARQAAAEAEREVRRLATQRKQAWQQDIANQRQAMRSMRKEMGDLREERSRSLKMAGIGAVDAGLFVKWG